MKSRVWIAVTLSGLLGPGAGQLYNKETRKGVLMLAAGLALLVVSAVWMVPSMIPAIPADLPLDDTFAMQKVIEDATRNTMTANAKPLIAFQVILMAFWIYGIVDAYRGARRRLTSAPAGPAPAKTTTLGG